jgi:hypothetical protein
VVPSLLREALAAADGMIADPAGRAGRLLGGVRDTSRGGAEPERAVPDREPRCTHPRAGAVAQHIGPRPCGLPDPSGSATSSPLGAECRSPCGQALLVAWARPNEDLTSDKTDDPAAMLIGRLISELRCYEPEPARETWAGQRPLNARRERLVERRPGRRRPAFRVSGILVRHSGSAAFAR